MVAGQPHFGLAGIDAGGTAGIALPGVDQQAPAIGRGGGHARGAGVRRSGDQGQARSQGDGPGGALQHFAARGLGHCVTPGVTPAVFGPFSGTVAWQVKQSMETAA